MEQTDVSHYDGLTWWGPVDDAQVSSALDLVDLPAGARAVDLGCGRGELLVRLAGHRGIQLTGIDRSAAALAQARVLLDQRAPDAHVALLEMCAGDYEAEAGSLGFVANLGGPYAGDTYAGTLGTYARWLVPGGLFLSGHGFWMQEPCADYVDATEVPADAFTDHAGTMRDAAERGFELLHHSISSRAAWDAFEGRILENRRAYAEAHPTDEEARRALERSRRWNEAQQRWGRDTMGFALHLYRLRS